MSLVWDGELIKFYSDPANAPGNLFPTGEYIDYTAIPVAQVQNPFAAWKASGNGLPIVIIGVGLIGLALLIGRR